MYLEQIEQLVVLQKVDDEIIVLQQELENLPKELAELEQQDEETGQRLEQLNDKLDILKTQQKRLDDEIEDNSVKIKKSKSKLMMAENTREYHAMMREMDNMDKINRTREEERVALSEELERQKEIGAEITTESKELKEKLEEYRASIKKRTTAAKKRLNALEKQRNKACEVVPKPVLGRYEFIRARIHNPVIVSVIDGVCTGCNIQIPPQIFNDLQKGEQIISCPNCQRLTFWCEHFSADEKAPTSEAKAKENAKKKSEEIAEAKE
ncbi:zinc ribbon domain-containing protein [Desulfovibrio ferrophilus]|nr:C4-type zinc ribbon domain-containing protein [Desulfovibrio ferrophilus]